LGDDRFVSLTEFFNKLIAAGLRLESVEELDPSLPTYVRHGGRKELE